MTSVWDELAAHTGNGVMRDGRDNAYVFPPDHDKPLDFTKGKTVKGRTGYTRVTAYVSCLDDTSNLDKYKQRNLLAGMKAEPSLLVEVADALRLGTLDDKVVKDALNYIAERARAATYEDRKADTGTAIHRWCEIADEAIHTYKALAPSQAIEYLEDAFPTLMVNDHIYTLADHIDDVRAYLRATIPLLRPITIEQLVIVDELKVAGTPDRVVEWIGPDTSTPDGTPVTAGDVFIDDTKTGGLDYGAGKIACQLAIYANAVLYDQATNKRTEQTPRLRKDWAIIVHVPAGTGTAQLVWVDIAAGWRAVTELCGPVRAWRTASKRLTKPFPAPDIRAQIDAALTADEVRALWRPDWDDDLVAYAAVSVGLIERQAA